MLQIVLILLATFVNKILADLVNVTMIHNIMGIYTGIETTKYNRTSHPDADHHLLMYMTGHHSWLYVIIGIWITTIFFFVCTCLYCKCEKTETTTTSYSTDPNFELQQVHVHVMEPPHIKDCVCLHCLQRQLAKELQMKNQAEQIGK